MVSILLQELHVKYDITLVLMRKKIDYDIPQDVKVLYLEDSKPFENGFIKFLKLPFLALKYKKFCKSSGIDVSFALMSRPCYVAILSKLFGNRCVNIVSERSTPSSIYKDKSFKSLANSFLIKKLYPKADKIVANSFGNSNDLIENFHIKKNKVITLHNPCDVDFIRRMSAEKLDFRDDKFSFISVGRLDEGKNHKLLMKAVNDIDAKLYIVGDGVLKDELISYAKQNKLDKKVIFAGHQFNPYKFMAKADCFVFGSRYEGFPNVLLEALACGLPIISTDCKSGPREILAPNTKFLKAKVEIGKYGILTPIDDVGAMRKAMKLIMKDDRLRRKYIKKSFERVSEFDIKKIVMEYEKILICKEKK